MSNKKLHLRGATLIRNLYHGLGYTIKTLALLFNLSQPTIIRILKNEAYCDKTYNPTPSVLPLREHYDKFIATNPDYNHLAFENTFIHIKDYPRYIIFVDGAVFSDIGFCYKPLSPGFTTAGYPFVSLSNNTRTKHFTIHSLIAEHFIPNPHNLPCVLHKNDIRTDNRLSNLYWGTQKDNMSDMFKNGRHIVRIPDFTKTAIYETINLFPNISTADLARRFGISTYSVRKIRNEYENQRNQ